MNRKRVSKIIFICVAAISLAVIIGWILNIQLLISFGRDLPAMKFNTAISFFLSGLMCFSIVDLFRKRSTWAQITIYFSLLVISLIEGSIVCGILLNIKTGVEDIFMSEHADTILVFRPGMPSIMTLICFFIIIALGIKSIITLINNPDQLNKLKVNMRNSGIFFIGVSLCNITGYALNQPGLYYFIEGFSSAMALNSALLWGLLGFALLLMSDT